MKRTRKDDKARYNYFITRNCRNTVETQKFKKLMAMKLCEVIEELRRIKTIKNASLYHPFEYKFYQCYKHLIKS